MLYSFKVLLNNMVRRIRYQRTAIDIIITNEKTQITNHQSFDAILPAIPRVYSLIGFSLYILCAK